MRGWWNGHGAQPPWRLNRCARRNFARLLEGGDDRSDLVRWRWPLVAASSRWVKGALFFAAPPLQGAMRRAQLQLALAAVAAAVAEGAEAGATCEGCCEADVPRRALGKQALIKLLSLYEQASQPTTSGWKC